VVVDEVFPGLNISTEISVIKRLNFLVDNTYGHI
jgi:hypothetical protein